MNNSSKSFQEILNDLDQEHAEYAQNSDAVPEEMVFDIPVNDYEDMHVLMHKDAHFGGSFSVMLEYYQDEEAMGVQEELSIRRIQELQEVEETQGNNLSDKLLSPQDKAIVLRSFQAYNKLRTIAEKVSIDPSSAQLISHLILAEKENPIREIQNLIDKGDEAVDDLISLIQNPDFWNPLFPSYGHAPLFAIEALASIKNPKSLESIFYCLKHADFFTEGLVIKAIRSFGDVAKNFLKEVLQSEPHSKDNLYAALCLQAFNDPEISELCFKMLQEKNINHDTPLAQHLVLNLENLKNKEALKEWHKSTPIPPQLSEEIRFMLSLEEKK
jgi:hypothetical protein